MNLTVLGLVTGDVIVLFGMDSGLLLGQFGLFCQCVRGRSDLYAGRDGCLAVRTRQEVVLLP